MKIGRIRLHNFGSFRGEHTFRLSDRGLTIVLGDNQDEPRMSSNGSGKSTLLDALDWCLFGKIPRGDHADSVINEAEGKNCAVTVSLVDDETDTPASVIRCRGPNSLKFSVAGKDRTTLDTSETQQLIEQFLGLDRDVFHAAVLFGQTDLLRFADARDSDRMAILTKILQLDEIDEWLERAKAKRDNQTKSWTHATEILVGLNGQLQVLKRHDFFQDTKDWENMRADRMRQSTQELNQYMTSIDKAREVASHEATVLQSEQQAITSQKHTALDLSQFDTKLAQLRGDLQTHNMAKVRASQEAEILNARATKFKSLGGECGECGQPIAPDHTARELDRMAHEVTQLMPVVASAQREMQQVESGIRECEASREEHRRLHYEADKENNRIFQEIQGQKKTINEAKAYLAKTEPYVATLRTNMEEVRTGVNPYHAKQAALEQDIHRTMREIVDHEKEIEATKSLIDYYEFWVTGFGPRGLKSYILDTKLGELTEAANQKVRLLTGGTIWIRFETQTKGRSTKKLANKTNIRVFRYNPDGSISERNYRSWSGGEKERVSLGIDMGLSSLIAKRAKKSYDLLVFDELFKHLDQAGREAVMDMLKELRREKSSVIVVDHDQIFQSEFENIVTVRKKNGQSKIYEGIDDDRIKTIATKSPRTPQGNDVPTEKHIPERTGQITAF